MQNKFLCTHTDNKCVKKRRCLILLLLIFSLVLHSLFQLEQKVRPIACQIATNQSKAVAIKAIQQACNYVLKNNSNLYEELYQIQKAANGQIQGVEINTLRVNAMEDALIGMVNNSIEHLKDKPLQIPVGTLTGLQTLNGLGPLIKVQMIPLSLVTSQVSSRFVSVGVNQTKLEIYIHFKAEMEAVFAGFTHAVLAETDVVIAEIVIVGQVPQIYVQGSK